MASILSVQAVSEEILHVAMSTMVLETGSEALDLLYHLGLQ